MSENNLQATSADTTVSELTSRIQAAISRYVSYENGTVTIDLKTLRSNVETAIQNIRAQLGDHATVDSIMTYFDAISNDVFGITLSDNLSENTLSVIKADLAYALENNVDVTGNLLNYFDTQGAFNFLMEAVFRPLGELGAQVTGVTMPKLITGQDNFLTDALKVMVDKVFANDNIKSALSEIRSNLRNWAAQTVFSDNSSNQLEVIFNGTNQTITSGLYASNSTGVIDASSEVGTTNVIVANIDNTPGEKITGSSQHDLIFVGAGDFVNSGSSEDVIIFASGTAEVETQEVSDTVTSLAETANEYFVSTTFYDDHSRQYVGLGTNTNATVFGFEVGTEDYSDVVYLTGGSIADLVVIYGEDGIEIDNGAGKIFLYGNQYRDSKESSTTKTPSSASDSILIMDQYGNGYTVTPTVTKLSADNGVYTYTGGKAIIDRFESGQQINYSADYTGHSFSDGNLSINSSSGYLTIRDAQDKLVNFANASGDVRAYAYFSSQEGVLDGSSYDKFEVITGGNELTNVITAGNGGSNLWGGTGGVDTLTGGAGVDEFFFGRNDGVDVIVNAEDNDVVNLYNVNLSNIVSVNVENQVVSARLDSGAFLQVNSADDDSPTFKLADNSSYQYEHSTGTWRSA